MIAFFPKDTTTGREASGMTDKNGEFLVLTQGATRSGALPGNYLVRITKVIAVDSRGNPIVPSDEPTPMYAAAASE